MPRKSRYQFRDEGLFTVCDLADQIGVSQNTIRNAYRRGALRCQRVSDAEFRVPGIEALRWADINGYPLNDTVIVCAVNSIQHGHNNETHTEVISQYGDSLLKKELVK